MISHSTSPHSFARTPTRGHYRASASEPDSGVRSEVAAFSDTDGRASEHGLLKFFLVEDNVIIRDNLAETLHELVGAEIVGVSDAQHEATQWLCDASHQWDVAVIDIFLKRGNGIQVVAALQGHNFHQQVIVLSNYASPEVRRECLRLGASAVFDKSTELDDLLDYCAKVQPH